MKGNKLLDFLTFRFHVTPVVVIAVWILNSALTLLRAVNDGPAVPADWLDPLHQKEVQRLLPEGGPGEIDRWLQSQGAKWIAAVLELAADRVMCELFILLFLVHRAVLSLVDSLGLPAQGPMERTRASGQWWWDVLLLREFLFVYLVMGLWAVGSVALVVFFVLKPLPGLAMNVLCCCEGLLLWRMGCESLVVMFRISEVLAHAARARPFPHAQPTVGGLFAFDYMLMPWIIRLSWFVGLAALPVFLFRLVQEPWNSFGWAAYPAVLVLGVCVLRLIHELAVVVYTIHESLERLRLHLGQTLLVPAGQPRPAQPGYLFFRLLLLPALIQLVWFVLTFLPMLAAVMLAAGMSDQLGDAFNDLNLVPVLMIGLIPWLLIVRLCAEALMVPFAVNRSAQGSARVVAAAAPPAPAPGLSPFVDFLVFRTLLTPRLIQLLWVAVIAGAAAAIVMLGQALDWGSRGNEEQLLVGIAMTLGALLVVRLVLEAAIVWFSVHKMLRTSADGLGRLRSLGTSV